MTGAVVGGNEQSNGSENRGVHVDERAAGGEGRVWNGDLDERDVNAASCDILNREVKEPKAGRVRHTTWLSQIIHRPVQRYLFDSASISFLLFFHRHLHIP